MKKTIKQLKKEEKKIRKEIQEREEKEVNEVQIPRLKKMVGQCFAYRDNSFGGSEPRKTWDVFRKIIDWVEGWDRGFNFIIEEFQTNSDGKTTWEIDSHLSYTNKEWWGKEVPFYGYTKITEKEYNSAKTKMVEEMGSQKKMRKVLNSKWRV